MKILKSIEVVRSSTMELSSLSLVSALAIVASVSESYSNVTLTTVNTAEDLEALIERQPDLVFLGMMYVLDPIDPTKKVWMSEKLEQAGIPHTGSTRSSHELELQKNLAKQRVLDCGLATARFHVIPIDQNYHQQKVILNFPLFVKPVIGGGGEGVDEYSIVRTEEQLHDKVSSLRAQFNATVLVEQYLEGREFSVAIIKDRVTNELIAMPLELIAPKDINGERMLGIHVKSSNQEKAIYVKNPKEREMVSAFALSVFRALGARDYGRIDIRLDGKGIPNFLEANLIPSLISGYGSFPKAYKLNQGVGYNEMIHNIVLLGLSRDRANMELTHNTTSIAH